MDLSRWLIVIPARLKSERLPRKPLADLAGRPLVVRAYDNLRPLAKRGAHVVVALDHADTVRACEAFQIPYVMTKETHQSGTDRCAEVADQFSAYPLVLNVQGDEPFVNLDDLQALMSAMMNQHHQMGTLGFDRSDRKGYEDYNVVKIARADDGHAIYFSRAPIPFDRDASRDKSLPIRYTQHLGVYAFRREALKAFCNLPTSQLEQTEKLEQLRAVERGWKIHVATATTPSVGIDTAEDLKIAREMLR
jgi:3-deoxy-manno-octulosonate cytidylyltransferase (CMP-KDO synthetase)